MRATNKTRDEKVYLRLGRTLSENHYKTEKNKTAETAKEASGEDKVIDKALFKADQFFGNRVVSWFYHYIKSRFGRKHKFLTYERSKDNGIYKMENAPVKIACVADWGSDTPEADFIGRKIASHKPEYTIHLGDTYFVGSPSEIKHNFIYKNSSWHRGFKGSFALMGNHEMYSRGIGYFKYLLPSMGIKNEETGKYKGQKASFFCLENDYWRIIGLDSGYNSIGAIPILENISLLEKIPWLGKILIPKCSLPEKLMEWLQNTVKPEQDNRGLIFLSHHQYCSAFEKDYVVLGEQLGKVVGSDRPVLWIWGHEHRLSFYGKYGEKPCVSAYGRCIGNGGMPIELTDVVPSKETIKTKPLILYDNRQKEILDGLPIGYNGYSVLHFKNDELEIEYFDSEKRLVTEKWKADTKTGEVKNENIDIEEKHLSRF